MQTPHKGTNLQLHVKCHEPLISLAAVISQVAAGGAQAHLQHDTVALRDDLLCIKPTTTRSQNLDACTGVSVAHSVNGAGSLPGSQTS